MYSNKSSPNNQPQADHLLDPCSRIWFAGVGLAFILLSFIAKEVNILIFLTGSLFALLSFNGTRLSGITLGKDKVSAEMSTAKRVAGLKKENVDTIVIGDSTRAPLDLVRELSKPLNAGIQTQGYGLAQLINADEETRSEILREISTSSGLTSLSEERSIVGIGRVQDSKSSNKLFALMDDGSNYIVQYPNSLTGLYSKTSGTTSDDDATRPDALTSDPQGSR